MSVLKNRNPYPTYDIDIPTVGNVKVRPFNVAEDKLLMQAIELQDSTNYINTVQSVLKACTFGAVDVDALPNYLIDYLFLRIRTYSKGELVPVRYKCNGIKNSVDENGEPVSEVCSNYIKFSINLNNVQLIFPEGYEEKKIIKITDTSGMKLKAPRFGDFKGMESLDDDSILFTVIDSVWFDDSVYKAGTDFTKDDFIEFVGELPMHVRDKFLSFVEARPYAAVKMNIRCPACNTTHDIEIKELDDFFV